MKLSICIATYNRGAFIGETLDSILVQMEPGVEIIVVDGASPDDTPAIMAGYTQHHSCVRYFREQVNSGVDADFDKAVGYAKGEYCWLMTDDDLLKPGAITRVIAALGNEELIIANSEVRNVDLSEIFEARRLSIEFDKVYSAADREAMFAETATYLSFIGCVIIRRSTWIVRERSCYYGSLFIHVGVIFQHPPVSSVRVIAEPLITIRYGNAMWTPRRFEIWMFKWPRLVWSFPDFEDETKSRVCPREPWRSVKALFLHRAQGSYTEVEFRKFWPAESAWLERVVAHMLSLFPASLANMVMVLYFSARSKPAQITVRDLLFSRNASWVSRLLARLLGTGGG